MRETDSLADELAGRLEEGEPILMMWEEPKAFIRRQIWTLFKEALVRLITQKRAYIYGGIFFVVCWYFFPSGAIDIGGEEIPRWVAFAAFFVLFLVNVLFFGLIALLVMFLSRAGSNAVQIKKSGLYYSGMCIPFWKIKTVELGEQKIHGETIPILTLMDHQNDVLERIGVSATVSSQTLADLLTECIQKTLHEKEMI